MISADKLKETTNDFVEKFCNIDKPIWSEKWCFEGELPYNAEKGCYALLKGNEVLYIGLAISDSNNGSGLGSRISKYWIYHTTKNRIRIYKPTIDGIDSIITLPFTSGNFYLAAALEIYLIQILKPIKNKIHSKKD